MHNPVNFSDDAPAPPPRGSPLTTPFRRVHPRLDVLRRLRSHGVCAMIILDRPWYRREVDRDCGTVLACTVPNSRRPLRRRDPSGGPEVR